MVQPSLSNSEASSVAGPQSSRGGSGRPGEPGRSALRFSLPRWGNFPASSAENKAELLLAAWSVLLFRYSEQDEFTIELFWSSVGDCQVANAQFRLRADLSAGEVIAQAAELLTLGERYRPATRVRQALGFSIDVVPALALAEGGEQHRCSELHLVCKLPGPDVDGVECEIIYDPARFGAERIERMSRQYRVLVGAMLSHAETALRSLPLLDEQEQAALRLEWTGPRVATPFAAVFRSIERHAAERPDAIAIAFNTQVFTYSELNRRANQLARWLIAQGLVPGMTVAVSMEPCPEFVVSMLAVFKAGGTHVPLDPGYPPERLTVIIDDTRPLVVLTQFGLLSRLSAVAPRVHAVDEAEAELADFDDADLGIEPDPAQTAYIVYTSGTTGKPKGVLVTHANLTHYIAAAGSAYGYDSRDVIPAVARYSFSITFFELLSPLCAGGKLILLEKNHVLDLQRMQKTLEEATCIHCSPSLWRKIIAHIDEQKVDSEAFAQLRHVSSGGDMVPPDVLESLKRIFTQAEVFVIYGCSEISCMGCTYPVPRHRTLSSTRVGKAMQNMSLRLLDAEQNLVPPGVIGEVCFGGLGLAHGYLGSPELTAKKFVEVAGERLYQTGDLGRLDDEGNLELVGRSDFQIKLRGIRIEPAEVEANLRAIPGVRDAIVAAPTLQDGEKRLVAYVVTDPARPPSARQMRDFLKGRLPDYMVPAAYVLLDALPVNVNNKVDRLALARPSAMKLAPLTASDPPRNERERRLVAIWEKVLDVKGIGIRDEFFDIGGDSLRSVALMAEIHEQLGVALPVSTLLTEPTIELLAASLESDRRKAAQGSLVCLRRGSDEKPAVFFIHDGDGETMPYRNLALRLDPAHSVYGVHPKSSGYHPILHTRLDEMVDYYVQQIRSVQKTGPYLLGGLCIGGFLAFEVGRKLKSQGELVGPIALIDVAHVTTPPKSIATARAASFRNAMRSAASSGSINLAGLARMALQRVRRVVTYEARTRYERKRTRVKLLLLRRYLDSGLQPIPAFLRNISVDSTLRFAEKEYVIPAPYAGEALLFRATTRDPALDGLISDTPYIDIFQDPMLGWGDKVSELKTYDISAGHSSSLREPHVRQVATILQRHIDLALSAASSPG